ncbi:hypothetical protein VTK56DRAFT_1396 [Thermocarpiscus australiensis]
MSVSGPWPVEGHDQLGQVLPDSDFALTVKGQNQATSQEANLHHLLPEFDYWPFASSTNQQINGASLHPRVPAASESPRPSSRASLSSQNIDNRDDLSDSPVAFETLRSKNIVVELPTSTLVAPRSQYDGFLPPVAPCEERDALASLMKYLEAQGDMAEKDFVEFELDQFTFYINSAVYPFEMRPLQRFTTRIGHDRYYFDGVLCSGNLRHYVKKVEVIELPIGNYGTANPSVEGQIWVRSRLNARKEVYYRLKKPAAEYARYYTPFLWVADLAKHVVDYSARMIEAGRQVDLNAFKEPFIQWLNNLHQESPSFENWRRQHPSDDYRTSVAANIEFIWKEMNGVLGWKKASSLQLFRETIKFSQYRRAPSPSIPMIVQGDEEVPPTIVTPYIKECFGHMAFGKILKAVGQQPGVQGHTLRLRRDTSQLLDGSAEVEEPRAVTAEIPSAKSCTGRTGRRRQACFLPLEVLDQIRAGDTISTPRDEEMTGTKWQNMTSKDAIDDGRWFGLVQKVHIAKDGFRSFDVIWFYRPVETPCCMMKYPWPNELFLSDHCTCEEGHHARVKEHEVLAVHDIDWFGSPEGAKGEFFVRQAYIVESRRWVTLQKSHMKCSHGREKPGFRTGDTVLATLSASDEFTEPFEVVKVFKQGDIMFVRLRRLLRRRQIDPQAGAAPNELVYTEQYVVVKPDKVTGKCLVRFFRPGEPIPSPYNRDGTGNLFYITHRLESEGGNPQCIPFDGDFPASLRQGFDPTSQTFRKLRGMDLFCGSGNFGRGLEDGGAVKMVWANDIWENAIHTYMANSPDPKSTKPFLGSVDDLLRLALEGRYSDNVPRPGDVDFISAGSPCPGFSLLTVDKTTLTQMKNQSLVASFTSFVDFYRPKYGILENVVTIVPAPRNRAQDVMSQLFCAIVGMGYQAQLILGDAWSHGAPQGRSRVFLYFAAPGLQLPEAPLRSHSHFPGAPPRDVGKICNGEPYVRRSFEPAPFKYISAAEGTADLPRIGDGKADCCVAFPDHRVCTGVTRRIRSQIAVIPTHPYGMSFAKCWRNGEGIMTAADRELFPSKGSRISSISKGWNRHRPKDVFPTVTTHSQVTDARTGSGLHWLEDRPLTVQEVRRAQGFPDHEVLLGTVQDQWKLVGNSVARQMALALGLKLREAWVGTLYDDGKISREASESVESFSTTWKAGAPIADGVEISVSAADARRQRNGTIDLTSSTSPPLSLRETEGAVRSMSTPASTLSESTETRTTPKTSTPKASGLRKRLLSQSLEVQLPSAKVPKLSGRTSLALYQLDGGSPEPGSHTEAETEADTEATPARCSEFQDEEEEEEEVTPVPAGPTIVRLPTPEGLDLFDGLG